MNLLTRNHSLFVACTLAVVVGGSFGVSPAFARGEASADAGKALDTMARELFRGLKREGIERAAVSDFEPTDHGFGGMSTWLGEELLTRFGAFEGEPVFIERDRLKEVLEEQELGGSGLVDSRSAAALGEILGVGAIVLGSWSSQAESVFITARAISVNTAKVITTSSVSFLQPEAIPKASYLIPHSISSPRIPPQPLAKWQSDAFRIEVTKIQRHYDRKQAVVSLRYINQTDEELAVGIERGGFGRCQASLMDDSGGAHLAIGDSRGSDIKCVTKSAKTTDFTLLPSGTTPGSMAFKANENKLIQGNKFHLTMRLVLLLDGKTKHYLAGFENLELSE